MTIHQLSPRPVAAPALFPADLAAMLDERFDAGNLARHHGHVVPAHIIARQAAWSQRISARIAQVVS